VRFLVDAQFPPELAIWLTAQGHQADHVEDISTAREPAPRIVWIRIGNARNTELIARFEAVWDKVVENLDSGALVVQAGRS